MKALRSSLSGLLSILLVTPAANAWRPAAQTSSAVLDTEDENNVGGGLSLWLPPEPTVGPELWQGDLVKRAGYYNTPNDLCGYAYGLRADPLTCSGNGLNYCGYNSEASLFGCCQTYFTTNRQYSLTGCTFPTRCWDSTAVAANCNEACQLNPLVLACTENSNPYCVVYSITNNGLKALGCSTARMTVPVAEFIGGVTGSSSRIPTSSAGDLTSSSSPPAPPTSSSSVPSVPASGPVSSSPSSVPSSTTMPLSTYSFSSTPTTPHLNSMPDTRSQKMAGPSSNMPQVTISGGGTGGAGGGRVSQVRGACFVLSLACALFLWTR